MTSAQSNLVATDGVFAGPLPEFYDRWLVPLMFEGYARDLAQRVALLSPESVLETAAGTGVVTRALASLLPAAVRIVATDLNPPMLARASARLPDDARVVWRQADALALPFEAKLFDAVACQFGVMFFPDQLQAHREVRRVLRPGGHWLFSVWDRLEENEFAACVDAAVQSLFPHDPPRFMARTPHGHHDLEPLREQLGTAGFSSIQIEQRVDVSRASSAGEAALAFCQGTPLRNEIEERDPALLAEATRRASEALVQRFGTGPIEGKLSAFVVSAVA